MTDHGQQDREALLRTIQHADGPSPREMRRLIVLLITFGIAAMVLYAGVATLAQMRDDLRATRRVVERCR